MPNDPRIPTKEFLESIGLQHKERYLPSSIDESHTILEKLNRMGYNVNKNNELSEQLIKNWNDFSTWVDTEFDDDVKEKIANELTDEKIVNLTKPAINEVVDGKLIDINTKINESASQLETISVPLSKFKKRAGDISDSERIERAILYCMNNNKALRKRLMLESYVQLHTPIKIPTNFSLEGSSKFINTIEPIDSFTGKSLIMERATNIGSIGVRNIKLDCRNISGVSGVDLQLTDYTNTEGDSNYLLENLLVYNSDNHGYVINGQGELTALNLGAFEIKNDGFRLTNWDSIYTNLIAGMCGKHGIYVVGGPNKFSNCKAWGCNIGYFIGDKHNTFAGCEAQENKLNGIVVDGDFNNINMSIDGVGWDFTNQRDVPDSSAIKITTNAKNNFITGVVSNEIFNSRGQLNTIDYLVDCMGGYNVIHITGTGANVKAVKDGSDVFNDYHIMGSGMNIHRHMATDVRWNNIYTEKVDVLTTITMQPISASTVTHRQLFVDEVDQKLKFKDHYGVINLLY